MNRVLVWEPASGNLRWRDASTLSAPVNANNGCSIATPNTVQFGQNINAAGNPAQLLNNREVPMNSQNIYFLGQNGTTQGFHSMGIGYPNSFSNLPARLSVWENPANTGAYNNTVAVLGRNSSAVITNPGPFNYIGVAGAADGIDVIPNHSLHAGGYFTSNGGQRNYGVFASCDSGNANLTNSNIGGYFGATASQNSNLNAGCFGVSINGNSAIAGLFRASNGSVSTIGVQANVAGFNPSTVYYGEDLPPLVQQEPLYMVSMPQLPSIRASVMPVGLMEMCM